MVSDNITNKRGILVENLSNESIKLKLKPKEKKIPKMHVIEQIINLLIDFETGFPQKFFSSSIAPQIVSMNAN